jgi:dienelactone hydrolase
VTGPVQRFARQIASHGYIVAAPSSYHEFTGPEALAYDGPGTDAGNAWKIEKKLAAYDEDATLSVDLLTSMDTCNGRIGEFLSVPTRIKHQANRLAVCLDSFPFKTCQHH